MHTDICGLRTTLTAGRAVQAGAAALRLALGPDLPREASGEGRAF